VRAVGNRIDQVAQLRLQAGLAPQQKTRANAARLARLEPFGIAPGTVLEYAIACFKREIEPVVRRVAMLKHIDHAQTLQVVLEPAPLAHAVVQRLLPRMAKRRVPEVVRQADRLHQILAQPERACNRAPELRHLQRVREPCAKQIAFVVHEHLCLVFEPAECRRMHDAIAVALVVAARRIGRDRVTPPSRAVRVAGVGSQFGLHGQIRFKRRLVKR